MKIEWRPDDWEGILRRILDKFNVTYMDSEEGKLVEAGASAMLAALLKWLDELCDKREHSSLTYKYESYGNRSDCPHCLSELKESGK